MAHPCCGAGAAFCPCAMPSPVSRDVSRAGFEPAGADAALVLRRHAAAAFGAVISQLGSKSLDRALGGGVPRLGLTELHAAAMRDAAAVSGFALACSPC
jgi:hypothetical protein